MKIAPFVTLAAVAFGGTFGTATADPPASPELPAPDLVQKIRRELSGPLTDDSKPQPGVPHGAFSDGTISDSRIYPGTENKFRVYVPAQYNPSRPACLLVCLDGIGKTVPIVIDNLVAKGDMPVTIAVGVSSGTILRPGGEGAYRWNRSYEFDSTDGNFPRFVLDELLPRVESLATADGRPIRLSREAKDRAAMGGSTGGIGSFTLAWERPDSFSRVYSIIGTYVSMRGGNDYPAIVRKAEPKPIRVFLEDGSTDAWNPLFGSWFMANENMEAALTFSGYDVQHAWGAHGHDGGPGNVILPDVMRWLWAGWPAAVPAGQSGNDMLAAILVPGHGWERVGGAYASASALASGPNGDVCFDSKGRTLYRIGAIGAPAAFSSYARDVAGLAFGPDGTLYSSVPESREIIALDSHGVARAVAGDIQGDRLLVTSTGDIYAVQQGAHSDEPGYIWRIKPDGKREMLDHTLHSVGGVAFAPDRSLFFAAEREGNRVQSFVWGGDSLEDKEPFYWLHPAGGPDDGGTGEIAVDVEGNLYAATSKGIQVCDRNGRVRAILWLPYPFRDAKGLCWGGPGFDMLYVTDGTTIFRRKMKVPGYQQWSAPVTLPKSNGG